MKFPGPLENQRLSSLLERAISREAQMWKVNVPKIPTNQVISHSEQDLFTRHRLLGNVYRDVVLGIFVLWNMFSAGVLMHTCNPRAKKSSRPVLVGG